MVLPYHRRDASPPSWAREPLNKTGLRAKKLAPGGAVEEEELGTLQRYRSGLTVIGTAARSPDDAFLLWPAKLRSMEEAMNVGVTFLIALCGYLLAISAMLIESIYDNSVAAGAVFILAICCTSISLISNPLR
jgi:hypothetical protein